LARQVRIEYPGAIYHVFSRGNQKQIVFRSDDDFYFFLKCLREAHEKFGAIVHVYCLMPNHYHLFLKTPFGDLSSVMHFLNTAYTVYFNKKHKRCGHLFQGRYKSILIETGSYAKVLSQYIHLNPVRSEIVDLPEKYPWSSYEYYRGNATPEKWLDVDIILSMFGGRSDSARRAYADFVLEGIGKEVPSDIRDSIRKGILGSDEFIERIRKEHLEDKLMKTDREEPQISRLREKPDLSKILSTSQRSLGSNNRLIVPIAIYICHRNTQLKLREIGDFFSLSVSGVASAFSRARITVSRSAPLARVVKEIENELFKSGA
jgi:REP-associated tyrosine transposase